MGCCTPAAKMARARAISAGGNGWRAISTVSSAPKPRSEERRVGKEGRYWRDWSSDVCSSDLDGLLHAGGEDGAGARDIRGRKRLARNQHGVQRAEAQIGRASCRERGEILA